MRSIKIRRIIVTAVILLAAYLLQTAVFPALEIAGVKPNFMLIVTASFGFMRGSREGMLVGFVSGLLIDIQSGDMIGFYALIYLAAGYVNGIFEQIYFDEDIKLPLFLIAGTDLLYGVAIYFLTFLLRSDFNFLYYLNRIIIPETIYTIVITLVAYPLLLYINQRLEEEEKGVEADLFREIIDRIKEAAEYVMKSRLMVLILVFCMTSTVLIGRLFYLQIVRGEDYLENYELQIRRTDSTAGTRGNIYDRNGNVLAYNELAYAVTIKDTMPADTDTDEYNEILNSTLDQVLELVEKTEIQ